MSACAAVNIWVLAALVLCAARAADANPGAQAEPDWEEVSALAATVLADYVRIDTQNPPGRTVEAAAFLEQRLSNAGLEIERIAANPEKPFVIARLRGSAGIAKPIILLNHMDVVPADPAKWSFPPLSGETRDGVLYGRGTVDMKGFGVAQLLALELLASRNERPRHDVVFLAVPDEEVGGTEGVAWLVEHRPDLMNAVAVWDEGGYGVSGMLGRPVFFAAVTEKQVLWVRLLARGPSGHGSRPLADSAPMRLQRALERILTQPPAPRLTPLTAETFHHVGRALGGLRGFVLGRLSNPLLWALAKPSLEAEPLTNAAIRDTIALTMLEAGYAPNVIPEGAQAVLDCRLLPDTDAKAFLDWLALRAGDDSVTIEVIQAAPAVPASPTANPLFEAIAAAVSTVYPESIVTPFVSLGGTDSRFFRRQGTPAYGLIPIPLPAELLATAHGVDERIPVATLGPAVRVVYETLRQL